MQDGNTYTISIEAKSIRTLRALETAGGCVADFALAFALGTVLAATTWWVLGGFWGVAAAVVAFLGTAVLVVRVLDRFRLFVTRAPVIDQVARYPGNERWVAVPQDAVRRTLTFDELREDCRRAGVGIIGIPHRGAPVWHLDAARNKDAGNKLMEYMRGDKLLKDLTDLAERKRTKPILPHERCIS